MVVVDGGPEFLSTPSARRATRSSSTSFSRHSAISIHALREEGDKDAPADSVELADFYPRPPRGGRLDPRRRWTALLYFYPRPPRGGRPSGRRGWRCTSCYFYPRPPRGGRPEVCGADRRICEISIHALREEGDYSFAICLSSFAYFYPRPPRGGRLAAGLHRDAVVAISIHALREEGDRWRAASRSCPC